MAFSARQSRHRTLNKARAARLALRRPALYRPLLALHRSPVDGNATGAQRSVPLVGVQWPEGPSLLDTVHPAEGALTVLPELSGLPSGLSPDQLKARAERKGGAFEQALSDSARVGKGYLVGSYPERDGDRVYHTVVLAGPDGAILGRYRATHPDATHASWAAPGDEIAVMSGRRPLVKGCLEAVVNVSGAVMSTACLTRKGCLRWP